MDLTPSELRDLAGFFAKRFGEPAEREALSRAAGVRHEVDEGSSPTAAWAGILGAALLSTDDEHVIQSYAQFGRFLGIAFQVRDDYLGGGYAVMGNPEREAIQLFARHEGLLVDPVYTGRAAAGLIDLIRRRFFKPEETVLFWHTGGLPALFADQYLRKIVA